MIMDGEEGVVEAQEAPETDLASQIEDAVEGQEKSADRPAKGEGDEPEPKETRPYQARRRRFGRDAAGKFEAGPGPVEAKAPDGAQVPKVDAPVIKPPPRGYSVKSRVAWDKEAVAPEEWAAVKDDIVKREAEFDSGFQRYAGLAEYAKEAEKNGTSIQNAVNDYVQVENELRADFPRGIEFICHRMGMSLPAVINALAERYNVAGAKVEPNGQAQVHQQIDPNAIASHAVSVVRSELEQRDIQSKIEEFKTDPKNKFFDNVRQDMSTLVSAGKAHDLKTAYEAACWLNPEIRQILIDEATTNKRADSVRTAERAKNAAKAVTGAPSPGSDSDRPARGIRRSIADEIRHNLATQEGG